MYVSSGEYGCGQRCFWGWSFSYHKSCHTKNHKQGSITDVFKQQQKPISNLRFQLLNNCCYLEQIMIKRDEVFPGNPPKLILANPSQWLIKLKKWSVIIYSPSFLSFQTCSMSFFFFSWNTKGEHLRNVLTVFFHILRNTALKYLQSIQLMNYFIFLITRHVNVIDINILLIKELFNPKLKFAENVLPTWPSKM